jgi:uncharacterized DUF497 family protein
MEFEWDAAKAAANLRKHRVSFEEASTVFSDDRAIEWFDEAHSDVEERFVTVGLSAKLRVLMVVHTERAGDTIRIISARKAEKAEIDLYAQG